MSLKGLFHNQIFDVPVFVAFIRQETSDDQRNLLFSELLHCDNQRVGLAIEFNHDWGVKTNQAHRRLEITLWIPFTFTHISILPDLQCSRSKHSCSLIFGHVWSSDSFLGFRQFSRLATVHNVIQDFDTGIVYGSSVLVVIVSFIIILRDKSRGKKEGEYVVYGEVCID